MSRDGYADGLRMHSRKDMPRMMSKPSCSMVMGWKAPTHVGLPFASSGPFKASVTVSSGWM